MIWWKMTLDSVSSIQEMQSLEVQAGLQGPSEAGDTWGREAAGESVRAEWVWWIRGALDIICLTPSTLTQGDGGVRACPGLSGYAVFLQVAQVQLRVLSRCSSVVAAETMFTCQLPLSLSPPLRQRLFLVAERLKFKHHQDLDSKLRLEYLLCVHILHCFSAF